jgi:hypothetical protein
VPIFFESAIEPEKGRFFISSLSEMPQAQQFGVLALNASISMRMLLAAR